MRARVERAHGAFADDAPLTNYHSFALRVVREWGWLLGISPVLRIADAAERWLHVEAVLDELRPALLWNPLRPHDLMDPLLDVIGTAKQELVTPDAYAAWAAARLETLRRPRRAHRPRTPRRRRARLRAARRALPARRRLRLRRLHPVRGAAASASSRRCAARSRIASRHVMVDEYQDTNYAQAKLVETLVAGHRNLFVVADDDQSIYKFRGASRANLDRFSREYPGASPARAHPQLPEHRADRRRIASGDRGRQPGDAHREAPRRRPRPGAAVEVWQAPEERSEAMAVARECARLIAAGTRPADIAWLFRQHIDMQPAMRALRQCGVPYQVAGGRGFFQEREIKDALALLAAIEDPDDSQAVLRCLTLPAWGVTTAGSRGARARGARARPAARARSIADAAVEDLDDADLAAAQRLRRGHPRAARRIAARGRARPLPARARGKRISRHHR